MRAVEWGLRALGASLGIRHLRSKSHGTGQVSYTPIAYADWDKILNALQSKIEKEVARRKRGPKKQLYQEFYYPALLDIRAMKDAWRNHVMHTRREYSLSEAEAIKDRVEALLRRLATRLSEV